MTIEDIAKKHKLRTEKLGDEIIIPGRLGHLFMWSDVNNSEDILGAVYSTKDITSKGWNQRRAQWEKAGSQITQNGETEGVVLFPASQVALIKLSIKLLRLSRKKILSPETKARLTATLAKHRQARKKAV